MTRRRVCVQACGPGVTAFACLLLVFSLAGCHHRAAVSSRQSPPPVGSRTTAPASVRRVPQSPAPAVTYSGVDDNAVPSAQLASTVTGLASWYGPPYNNRAGANGKIYDQNAMTAAHRTLPMGTVLQVTNLTTHQAVDVTVTDRGPFVHGRVLDLSLGAAKAAGVYRMGVAGVRFQIIQQGTNAAVAGRWCVQIGAFLDAGNALHLQTELQRRYVSAARVIEFQGPTGYWVRIDPSGWSRAQATQIANAIHAAEPGALPYLVRLD